MELLAVACEALITSGHIDPFKYTPRRVAAFYTMLNKRHSREHITLLNLTRLAYHGDDKAVNKVVRELSRG